MKILPLVILLALSGCGYDKNFIYNRTRNDYDYPDISNNYDDENNFFEDEDPVRADKKNSDVETSSKPNKHKKPQSSIPSQHNNPSLNSDDTAPIPSKHAKPRL